ncbi:MAG: CoA transferase, partial [Bradyrhizobium sp.]|nr:CoA transferase [Bradyrhizobium sp.]
MEDGIFEGLRVLDCASFIAAPAAATVLSDFGAEVI